MFELYKFINFESTHVEIAKEQKSRFELYKFINFEGTHVEIAKEQKSKFELYKFRRHPCRNSKRAKE